MPFSYYENLPENWEVAPLSLFCQLENRRKTIGKTLPYLDAKTLRGSKDKSFLECGVQLKKGEKVILVDGENSGEVFTIPYCGYMGSTFKPLEFSKYVNQEYVLLIIQNYRELLKNNKTGSAIPHLNKKLFKSLQVGLPSLAEQTRITEIVEMLFSKINEVEQSLS